MLSVEVVALVETKNSFGFFAISTAETAKKINEDNIKNVFMVSLPQNN